MNNVIEGFELLNENQEVLNYIISQIEKLGLNDDPFKIKDGNVNNGNNNNPNDNNANGNNIDNNNMNQNNGSDSQDINDATKEAQSNANQALQQEQNKLKQEQQQEQQQQNQEQNTNNTEWIKSTDTNYKPNQGAPIYYYDDEIFNHKGNKEPNFYGNFNSEDENGNWSFGENGDEVSPMSKFTIGGTGDNQSPTFMYKKDNATPVSEQNQEQNANSDWIKGTDTNFSPKKGAIIYQYDDAIFNGNKNETEAQQLGEFTQSNDKQYQISYNGTPKVQQRENCMYKKSDIDTNNSSNSQTQTKWTQGGESDTNKQKKQPYKSQMLYNFNKEIYDNNGPEEQAEKIGFFLEKQDSQYTYRQLKPIKEYTASDFTNNRQENLRIFIELAKHYDVPDLFPSVTVAQAIWESGWGAYDTSKQPYTVFKEGNNCFGIQAGGMNRSSYTKGTVTTKDKHKDGTSYNAKFRAYKSVNDSFLDRIEFLHTNSNYAEALKANTASEQIQKIAPKYAEAETKFYIQQIVNIINNNKLSELDNNRNTDNIQSIQQQNTMYLSGSGNNGDSGGNGSGSNGNNNDSNNLIFDEETQSTTIENKDYVRGDNLLWIPKIGSTMYVVDQKNPNKVVPSNNGTFKSRDYNKDGVPVRIIKYNLSNGSANPMHIWYKKSDAQIIDKYSVNENFPIKYGEKSQKIYDIQKYFFDNENERCKDSLFGPVMLDIFNKQYGLTSKELTEQDYNNLLKAINNNNNQQNNNNHNEEKSSFPKNGAILKARSDREIDIFNDYGKTIGTCKAGGIVGIYRDTRSTKVGNLTGLFYKVQIKSSNPVTDTKTDVNATSGWVYADDITFDKTQSITELNFVLERKRQFRSPSGINTIGELSLNGKTLFYTIEDAIRKDFQKYITAIPAKTYEIKLITGRTKYTLPGNGIHFEQKIDAKGQKHTYYEDGVYGNNGKVDRKYKIPTLENVYWQNGRLAGGIQIHPGRNAGWSHGCIIISSSEPKICASDSVWGFEWKESVSAYHKFWDLIRQNFDKNFNPIAKVTITIKDSI